MLEFFSCAGRKTKDVEKGKGKLQRTHATAGLCLSSLMLLINLFCAIYEHSGWKIVVAIGHYTNRLFGVAACFQY